MHGDTGVVCRAMGFTMTLVLVRDEQEIVITSTGCFLAADVSQCTVLGVHIVREYIYRGIAQIISVAQICNLMTSVC